MSFELLEDYIANNDIDKARSIISDIGAKKNKEAVPILIKYLQNTDSNLLRNEIAIALSDIGCSEAVLPLINTIKNPKTDSRGTLLYALQSFDYSPHFEFMVSLLDDDTFEVSRQALVLIEAIVKTIPEEIKQNSINIISDKIVGLQEKIDFLEESLDIINQE